MKFIAVINVNLSSAALRFCEDRVLLESLYQVLLSQFTLFLDFLK